MSKNNDEFLPLQVKSVWDRTVENFGNIKNSLDAKLQVFLVRNDYLTTIKFYWGLTGTCGNETDDKLPLLPEATSAEMTEFLLKSGVKANQKASDGESALLKAVRNNNYEQVRLLIAASADVNATTPDGEDAHSLAVKNNEVKIAKLLRQYGAKINWQRIIWEK